MADKQPPDRPDTGPKPDAGSSETLGIMEALETIAGKVAPAPLPKDETPSPEDVETPKGMP